MCMKNTMITGAEGQQFTNAQKKYGDVMFIFIALDVCLGLPYDALAFIASKYGGRTRLIFIALTVTLKAAVKLADVVVLVTKNRRISQSIQSVLGSKAEPKGGIFKMTNKAIHFNRAAIQNNAFAADQCV
uniref:Uncharacterized protein n=1 Tax=Romanomermis culicivorax TaxID=13658 RepID=A0A915HJG1_ROMCU